MERSNSFIEEEDQHPVDDIEDEDYDESVVNDLDNIEDIKVPVFIKKRSENRYKREQEQLKLQ